MIFPLGCLKERIATISTSGRYKMDKMSYHIPDHQNSSFFLGGGGQKDNNLMLLICVGEITGL